MNSPGTVEKDHIVLEENGWRVWRRVTKKDIQCIAIKPGIDNDWPHFVNDHGLVNGAPGFYMAITAKTQRPYFGFYGATSFGKTTFIDYQGETLYSVDDRELVLSLENAEIPFRIITQVTPGVYQETEAQSGTVDFTGANTAYEAMMACYSFSIGI